MEWLTLSRNFKIKVLSYLLVLGIVFGNIAYLIFLYDPAAMLVKTVLEIKPNSFITQLFQNPPYDIMMKMYLFNVTNHERFLNEEEKLSFDEVGPYTYREILTNANLVFEGNGTLSYVPQRKLVFVPELSAGNPVMDHLLLSNLPLLGITSAFDDSSMLTKMAIGQIGLATSSQSFVNLSVDDYFFGYDDVLISLANTMVPKWIDFRRFGILDRVLALDNASTTVNMFISDSRNDLLYSIHKLNGSDRFLQWSDEEDECSTISNCYEGSIFPQNLNPNMPINLYRHSFCLPLPITFNHSDSDKYGFETYIYQMEEDFLTKEDCFCFKECLPKGIRDVSPCYYGIPLAISRPHFLNTDPMVGQKINGMLPDREKHQFYLTINPQSGLVIEGHLRLQMNLYVKNTLFNYRTRPFNDLVLPLVWVDVTVHSPTFIRVLIYIFYVVLPNVQIAIKYVLTILSVVFTIGSSFAFTVLYIYNYRRYSQIDMEKHYEIEMFYSKM